jgi:hypothetical protein
MLEFITIEIKINKLGLLLERKEVGGIDFRIPEIFLKVITKMLPEVKTVEILSVDSYNMISAFTFEAVEHFMVRLKITIEKGQHPRGGMSTYAEKIKNYFRMTYPKYDFVSFEIMKLDVEPDLSNMGRFVDLFGVKKEWE